MKSKFGIWVHSGQRDSATDGFLTAMGNITATMALALRFDTVEEAYAEITRRGIRRGYDVVVGQTTAYVCHIYEP